jgi:hypothetical protein
LKDFIMQKNPASQSHFFKQDSLISFAVSFAGALLTTLSLAAPALSGIPGRVTNSPSDSIVVNQNAGPSNGNATAATTIPSAARVGSTYEIEFTASGRSARSVLLGVPPSQSTPGEGAPATQNSGTILWIDRNHQNAVAQNVAITGDGRYVITGWWLSNARASLYDTVGTGIPLWSFPISTAFFVPVDASFDGSIITATGTSDNVYRWTAPSATPVCIKPQPPGDEGRQAITPRVGGRFAGCSLTQGVSPATIQGQGENCSDLFSIRTLPDAATSVWGRYASAGAWIAVNTRDVVYIYDSQSGLPRGNPLLVGGEGTGQGTEATVGISGDGNVVAIGGYAHVLNVYQWNGAAYASLWSHNIPSTSWITAIDISDDGTTAAVGTLKSGGGVSVLLYNVATGPTPLWINSDFGDYVDDVDLTPDGARVIAGSWGGTTSGHLVAAFDRGSSVPIFAVEVGELTGVSSCFSAKISSNGRWACAVGKAVHAHELGSGGYVMALDLEGSPTVRLLSAASRKTHGSAGTFEIDLPLSGAHGIECRSGGANNDYTIVFTFANTLTSVGSASVTGGTGSVNGSKIDTTNAHNYVVNLTGVTNAQTTTIRLTNVIDSAGNSSSVVSATMAVLVGDVNTSGVVTSGDTNLCKAQALQPVTQDNFRSDINASGDITTGDVNLIKQNALSHL